MDLRSGGRSEESCNEVALRAHVIPCCTDNLSLADHRHRLKACDRLVGCHEAHEAQPRTDQPFDMPVILLDDVVEKFHLPELGKPPELAGTFHSLYRDWISGV